MKDTSITSNEGDTSISDVVTSAVSGETTHNSPGMGSKSHRKRKSDGASSYSEAFLCAMVSCLLMGVCTATCNNSTTDGQAASNCNMTLDLNNQTQAASDGMQAQGMEVPINTSTSQPGNTDTDVMEGYDILSSSEVDSSQDSSQGSVVVFPKFKLDESTKTDANSSTEGEREKMTIKGKSSELSDTAPESTKTEESGDINIVAIIIPFVSVILAAITLCVIYRLCRRYKCCKNEECLKKCSAICDSCMGAPFVYQAPGIKDNDKVSYTSETTQVSHHSGKTNVSQPSAIYRQPNGVPRVSHRPVDNHRLSWRSNASPRASNQDLSRSPSHHGHHPLHPARQVSSGSVHSNAALLAHHNSLHVARHDSGRIAKQGSAHRPRTDSGASRRSKDSALESLNSRSRCDSGASRHSKDSAHEPLNPKATPSVPEIAYDSDRKNILCAVIPIVAMLGFALLVFIICKLYRKYKCCCSEECIVKCSPFCDACALPWNYPYDASVVRAGAYSGQRSGREGHRPARSEDATHPEEIQLTYLYGARMDLHTL